jgi:hypothetical protein
LAKILEVQKEQFTQFHPDLKEISSRLDTHGLGEKIDILNWQNFSYKPEVSFNIAYGGEEIYLKYYINEEFVKAEKTKSNQMVCEDSCVEFFVSPADDGIYYNFEFNPIGTCLLGSGTSRHDRIISTVSIIEKIRRISSFGSAPFKEQQGKFSWTITAAIPFDTFFRHEVKEVKGKIFRANFYKCGDKLSHPHYLTWNLVPTHNPDYHRPEYFGILKFE